MFKGWQPDKLTGRHGMMHTVRSLVSLTIMLAATFAVSAAELMVSTVELQAYGLMEPAEVELAWEQSDKYPRVDHIKGVRFTRNTQRITANPKTTFGISYTANSSQPGANLDIVHKLIFPAGGLQDPAGRRYDTAIEELTIRSGMPVIYGYGFDEDWERVPGEWVFQVWYHDARILQKTFTVLPVGEAPPGNSPD